MVCQIAEDLCWALSLDAMRKLSGIQGRSASRSRAGYGGPPLLRAGADLTGDGLLNDSGWPRNPRALGGRRRRAQCSFELWALR
jgi:hypothetical protein